MFKKRDRKKRSEEENLVTSGITMTLEHIF